MGAPTDMGNPASKVSEGDRFEIVREWGMSGKVNPGRYRVSKCPSD